MDVTINIEGAVDDDDDDDDDDAARAWLIVGTMCDSLGLHMRSVHCMNVTIYIEGAAPWRPSLLLHYMNVTTHIESAAP